MSFNTPKYLGDRDKDPEVYRQSSCCPGGYSELMPGTAYRNTISGKVRVLTDELIWKNKEQLPNNTILKNKEQL